MPVLPRAEWTEAARDVFAFWGEPGARENGSKTNMVMVLAHHPALALSYYHFGRHLLIDSTLPSRARELVVLRVAWLVRSAYEWHYHVGYAVTPRLHARRDRRDRHWARRTGLERRRSRGAARGR